MFTKRFLVFAAVFCLTCSAVFSAGANEFPSQPINLIVPSAPGGGTDVAARALAAVGTINNQPLIVVNKPGSNSMVGAREVINARPDGHTLLFGWGSSEFLIPRHLQQMPIDTFADFKPVIGVVTWSACLAVPFNSPFKTLKDLVDYAKQNPGKLKWTFSMKNSGHWILGMDFFNKNGIKLTEVPNDSGGAEARNLLAGGHVDVAVFGTLMGIPLHNDKLRVLAVAFPQREKTLPDVPTFDELGYNLVETYDLKIIAASSKTPDLIVNKLYTELRRMVDTPEYKKAIENGYLTPIMWSPEECLTRVKEMDRKYGEFAKTLK